MSFQKEQKKNITGTRLTIEINKRHQHHHINYKDIKKLIEESKLNENVKSLSLKIFEKLAIAESKVHNISIDDVHFHEVGAIDSIVDIVGGAIAIDYLKPEYILSTRVELGKGFVKCAHGTFPVPAPATIEILKNIPVSFGKVDYEATTPTGAAIIASCVNEFVDNFNFIPQKIGYGLGTYESEVPDVLRVFIGKVPDINMVSEKQLMIECNIDDMNPEIYEYIIEKLLNAGASEVYIQPVIMKKSRPANLLSVLCDKNIATLIEKIILEETTTIGLRKYEVDKIFLNREFKEINTSIGKVRIKVSYFDDRKYKVKPEYEDCLAIAREKNLSLNKVYEIINNEIRVQFDKYDKS